MKLHFFLKHIFQSYVNYDDLKESLTRNINRNKEYIKVIISGCPEDYFIHNILYVCLQCSVVFILEENFVENRNKEYLYKKSTIALCS